MTPNESAEIIPQEFMTEQGKAAAKYKEQCKIDRDRGYLADCDFSEGAQWAYRHLAGQFPRWVKCSERMPDKEGAKNSFIIRSNGFGKDWFGHDYPHPFVAKAFKNFDTESPKFYFAIGNKSFLTNE